MGDQYIAAPNGPKGLLNGMTAITSRIVGVSCVCFVVLLGLAAIATSAQAQCPNMRIEQVDFTNNENVLVDHQKGFTHKEIENRIEKTEELEKPIEVDQFKGEVGEVGNMIEWKSPKAGQITKNWPIAYPGGAEVELKARLALEPGTAKLLEEKLEKGVTVTGETTVSTTKLKFEAEIPEAEAKTQAKKGYLETAAMKAKLPNEVLYQSASIKWKWKFKEKGGGISEGSASESTHNLYLTYKKAAGPVYFTFLAEDTERVHKESATPTEAQTVAGVWKGFSASGSPTGMHIWIYNPASGAISQGIGSMWYYQEVKKEGFGKVRVEEENAFARDNGVGSASKLLEYLDGECGAWAKAFQIALEDEGVASAEGELIEARPKVEAGTKCAAEKECEMLIKNWKIPNAGGNFPNKTEEVIKEEGIPGQGVKTPSAGFSNHFVVEVEKKLYDPSYGVGPIAGTKGLGERPKEAGAEAQEIQKEWQKKSIAGFCKFIAAELKCQQATNALEIEF